MSTSAKPQFWRPGSLRPGSSLDRASETSFPLLTSSSTTTTASALPIHASRLSILHALESSQFVIIVSPTGSGKTTQIPQFLYHAGWASSSSSSSSSSSRTIGVTQPRRIAATTMAARVASELGVTLGEQVGYTIRFEDHSCSAATRIKYVTAGTLLRECMRDPLLTRYSVVVVDEAHERSAETDLVLGVLKKVCSKRRDLRVVVCSATVDVDAFRAFFEEQNVRVVQVDAGPTFPVDIAYLKRPCDDYLQETIETIWKIHLTEPKGDILAFLTGRDEIEAALQQLSDRQVDLDSSALRMHLLPLHSGLSIDEQASIFQPARAATRKVVIATNIAETSITLDGIAFVVDCGLVKTRIASSQAVVDVLRKQPISRASAIQRAGRAGRTRPGKCFRLYTEASFLEMREHAAPELTRVDLASTVLLLKSLGIDNLVKFGWLAPAPSVQALAEAVARLYELRALDDHARLTVDGGWMGELPLAPHLARILVSSAKPAFKCAQEMLSILAMLTVTQPFFAPESTETQLSMRRFAAHEGDFVTLLNVFLAFVRGGSSRKWCTTHRVNFPVVSRAVNIRAQLHRFLHRFAASLPQDDGADTLHPDTSVLDQPDAVQSITKCLCTGLYANLARYNPSTMTYSLASDGREVWVHPTSTLFNRQPANGSVWVVFGQAVQSGDAAADKIYIRDLAVLDELEWATSVVPGKYRVETRWGREAMGIKTSGGGS